MWCICHFLISSICQLWYEILWTLFMIFQQTITLNFEPIPSIKQWIQFRSSEHLSITTAFLLFRTAFILSRIAFIYSNYENNGRVSYKKLVLVQVLTINVYAKTYYGNDIPDSYSLLCHVITESVIDVMQSFSAIFNVDFLPLLQYPFISKSLFVYSAFHSETLYP